MPGQYPVPRNSRVPTGGRAREHLHLHLLMAPTFSVSLNTRDIKAEIFGRGGRTEEIKVDVEISELELPEPERVPRLTSK
jgi:hypothetical protein